MKIAIATQGMAKAIIDHTNYKGELESGTQAVFVDNPLVTVRSDLLPINTSVGLQNLMLHPEMQEAVFADILKKEPEEVAFYAAFNGEKFSDFVEISYSSRFMTHEVGPNVGFTSGVGCIVGDELSLACMELENLVNWLKGIKYHGMILIGMSSNFHITSLRWGYFAGPFALFREFFTNSVEHLLEFCAGVPHDLIPYDDVLTLCVLVTRYPYPVNLPNKNGPISARKNAEPHLWRNLEGYNETVIASSRGSILYEARRRIMRSIKSMLEYDENLQYRTDFGLREKFILSQEFYEKRREKKEIQFSRSASST